MQNRNKETLLLTASVDPSVSNTPHTSIVDPVQRQKDYLQNLELILKSKAFDQIVFCENTNYSLNLKNIKNIANENRVELEFLSFLGSPLKIEEQGKGYGEGEIIKYALRNSKLLKNSGHFYKITGRIKIDNLKQIVASTKDDNVFLRYQKGMPLVDTRFFKCEVEFYKTYLLNAYNNSNDSKGIYLEHTFYNALKDLKKIEVFKIYPKYNALSGSTGVSYRKGWFKYLAYQIMLKVGILKVN